MTFNFQCGPKKNVFVFLQTKNFFSFVLQLIKNSQPLRIIINVQTRSISFSFVLQFVCAMKSVLTERPINIEKSDQPIILYSPFSIPSLFVGIIILNKSFPSTSLTLFNHNQTFHFFFFYLSFFFISFDSLHFSGNNFN